MNDGFNVGVIVGILLGLLIGCSIIDDMEEFTLFPTDKVFRRVEVDNAGE